MEKHFKIREDLHMKYYGHTLYRIEATKDLPQHGVKVGDLGGWVETEDNLIDSAWIADEAKVYSKAEVSGDAKVFSNAKVYGNAIVGGNARVCGNARIYGNARAWGNAIVLGYAKVFGNAIVFDNTEVRDNAEVFGKAWVNGNADVYGNAVVCGNADVYGNAVVIGDILKNENDCKNIIGEQYNITITPKYIKIGCQHHTKEEWWNFTDREILEMDGKEGLKWWKKWKPILQLICEEK